MTRLFILIALIASMALIVSCNSPAVQPAVSPSPAASPTQPVATPQPSATPVQPPASATATSLPVKLPATAQPTAAPVKSATQTPSNEPQKLNIDEYFPQGRGRDLLLNSCTGCHGFVPIITGQRTKVRWESIRLGHRDTSLALSDSDYNTIFDYLRESFNDTKPEPKLPEWFLQQQVGIAE